MYVDIHGYDTRSGENRDLYMPRVIKDIYKLYGYQFMESATYRC